MNNMPTKYSQNFAIQFKNWAKWLRLDSCEPWKRQSATSQPDHNVNKLRGWGR